MELEKFHLKILSIKVEDFLFADENSEHDFYFFLFIEGLESHQLQDH